MNRATGRSGMPFGSLSRLAGLIALVAPVVLGGCSSGVISDLPTWAGGLPPNAPERPAAQAEYPAVHDMPAPRETPILTSEEQQKLESDLAAQRARTLAGSPPAKAKSNPPRKAGGATTGGQRQP